MHDGYLFPDSPFPASFAQSIPTGLNYLTLDKIKNKKGFSLVEALVALTLTAVIAGLAISVLVGQNKAGKAQARTTYDFISHLATVYRIYDLQTGRRLRNSDNTDGIADFLPDYESTVTHVASSPEHLQYPEGAVLYLKPEQLGAISDPIYTGSENRDWLLFDIDGTAGSNSIAGGDQVLLYINNNTGQVLTAWQVECDATQSYYDINYVIPNGGTCDLGIHDPTTTTTTTSSTSSTSSSSSTTGPCPDPTTCGGINTWDSCTCACVPASDEC